MLRNARWIAWAAWPEATSIATAGLILGGVAMIGIGRWIANPSGTRSIVGGK